MPCVLLREQDEQIQEGDYEDGDENMAMEEHYLQGEDEYGEEGEAQGQAHGSRY